MLIFIRKITSTILGFIVFIGFFSSQTIAQLQLAKIFSNGIVIQRDIEVPVWGKATAGDTVKIAFDGTTAESIVDSSGKWTVALPSHIAGGPFSMIVKAGAQTSIISNVYVGDVWLASGQSNMEMPISSVDNSASVIAAANYQQIRQFKIPKGLTSDPSDELPIGSAWTAATSANVSNFTAVGYFFAKELFEDLSIPIGIINATNGGSRIETWMSEEMLGYDETDTVLANGEPERQPTTAYNKVIHPLLNFPVKGFIWYQGESNADNMVDAIAYRQIFQTMITGWRGLWGLGDIPFLWVQLPNYGQVFSTPQNWDAWPQLRAGQSAALSLPNTGEAVTIDVGSTDIHPTKKEPVGHRLALVARKVAYGEDIVYSGPRYKKNLLRTDGKIEIEFNYIANGLVADSSSEGNVYGFAVAGADNNLAWAQAVIDSGKVLVWNDAIPEPLIVRYAWEYNPSDVNLYNSENLPAAPFLTDVNPGFKITRFQSGRSLIEQGQSTTLSWNVFGASSITLDGGTVDSAGTINISPMITTTYSLVAINREDANDFDSAKVTVEVLDPNLINRTLNKPVTSSTFEACCGVERTANLAVDGDMATRWSSAWFLGNESTAPDPNLDSNPDDEWISVDFGEIIDIERIILFWEAGYASDYNVEVSFDGYLWSTALEVRGGNGGEDNIPFVDPPAGRFMRIHGVTRATQYGYSLFEIAAYGKTSAKAPPTIKLNTNLGNVFTPGTSVTITASTTDSDGAVAQVSFYVDGLLLSADNSAPFEASWSASAEGEYSVTAIAVDDSSLSVQSAPLILYVDNGTFTRFEAENGVYSGTGPFNIINQSARSGGKYLQLLDNWKLTFNNVNAPSAGDCLLTMAYQLNYESPKTQYLVINGDTLTDVEFTAPSTTAWLQKGMFIPLKAGVNEIAIHGFWNWMSFDYIGVRGATIVDVKNETVLPQIFSLAQNYPNPFNPSTNISYTLPERSKVKLVIYDVTGQKITTLVNEDKSAGSYNAQFSINNMELSSGVYFYRLQAGEFVETKKMILLR